MQILISISCILNKLLPPFTWRITGRRSGLKSSIFFSFWTAVTPHGKGLADQNCMSTRCSVLCPSERQKGQSALWLYWLRKGTDSQETWFYRKVCMDAFFQLLSRTAVFSKENGIWKKASFLWRHGGACWLVYSCDILWASQPNTVCPPVSWWDTGYSRLKSPLKFFMKLYQQNHGWLLEGWVASEVFQFGYQDVSHSVHKQPALCPKAVPSQGPRPINCKIIIFYQSNIILST